MELSTGEAEGEEEEKTQLTQEEPQRTTVEQLRAATSGLGRLQQHSDQFGDVKVGGVVQGVHVGPAAPQTHVGAQRDQLTAETQRCGRVACTQVEREELSEQPREKSWDGVSGGFGEGPAHKAHCIHDIMKMNQISEL